MQALYLSLTCVAFLGVVSSVLTRQAILRGQAGADGRGRKERRERRGHADRQGRLLQPPGLSPLSVSTDKQ